MKGVFEVSNTQKSNPPKQMVDTTLNLLAVTSKPKFQLNSITGQMEVMGNLMSKDNDFRSIDEFIHSPKNIDKTRPKTNNYRLFEDGELDPSRSIQDILSDLDDLKEIVYRELLDNKIIEENSNVKKAFRGMKIDKINFNRHIDLKGKYDLFRIYKESIEQGKLTKQNIVNMFSRIFHKYHDTLSTQSLNKLKLEFSEFCSHNFLDSIVINPQLPRATFFSKIQTLFAEELNIIISEGHISRILFGNSWNAIVSYTSYGGGTTKVPAGLSRFKLNLDSLFKIRFTINHPSFKSNLKDNVLRGTTDLDPDAIDNLIEKLDSYIFETMFDSSFLEQPVSKQNLPELLLLWNLYYALGLSDGRAPNFDESIDPTRKVFKRDYKTEFGLKNLFKSKLASYPQLIGLLQRVWDLGFTGYQQYLAEYSINAYMIIRNLRPGIEHQGIYQPPRINSKHFNEISGFSGANDIKKHLKDAYYLGGFPYYVFYDSNDNNFPGARTSSSKLKILNHPIRSDAQKRARLKAYNDLIKNNLLTKFEVFTSSMKTAPQAILDCLLGAQNGFYSKGQFTGANKLPDHTFVGPIILKNSKHAVAIEVPVWRYYQGNLITGHIDTLLCEGSKIYIADYKPDLTDHIDFKDDNITPKTIKSHLIEAIPQVASYAYLLSLMLGLDIKDIKCVIFNQEVAISFDPEVIYKNPNDYLYQSIIGQL